MQKLKKSSKYTRCSFSKCEKMRSTSPRLHQPATPTRLPSFSGLPLTSTFPPVSALLALGSVIFYCQCSHTPCISPSLLLHYFIMPFEFTPTESAPLVVAVAHLCNPHCIYDIVQCVVFRLYCKVHQGREAYVFWTLLCPKLLA